MSTLFVFTLGGPVPSSLWNTKTTAARSKTPTVSALRDITLKTKTNAHACQTGCATRATVKVSLVSIKFDLFIYLFYFLFVRSFVRSFVHLLFVFYLFFIIIIVAVYYYYYFYYYY